MGQVETAREADSQATTANETVVSSWLELQDRLFEGSWREALQRFRPGVAFRGTPCADEPLASGLSRLAPDPTALESHLLRNFRKYARREIVAEDSAWNWLAIAQHYGLPTRLLDWTYSPYVALHFATEDVDQYDRDALVWCVDYLQTNRYLPEPLLKALRDEGSDVFTVEMLRAAADSLESFDALASEEFVVFLEPPSLDQRIVSQFALFSLLSSPCMSLAAWLQRHPQSFRRLRIPAALKWEVRDKLDQANITERVLFPGLDGLGRWLRRYYTPRRQEEPRHRP